MKVYHTKIAKLKGSSYSDLYPQAYSLYKKIKGKSKRRANVRSAYFSGSKVFLDLFWQHLHQKSLTDKARRLKFYGCALELVKNSKNVPESYENPMKAQEILHRFAGLSREQELFFVQIKENKNSDQKFLISVFPDK